VPRGSINIIGRGGLGHPQDLPAAFAYGGLYTYWRLILIELGELLRLGGRKGKENKVAT
jgi:hypothetical protein